jgi:hypothetical protein
MGISVYCLAQIRPRYLRRVEITGGKYWKRGFDGGEKKVRCVSSYSRLGSKHKEFDESLNYKCCLAFSRFLGLTVVHGPLTTYHWAPSASFTILSREILL